jgi:cytochrome d ubiquinol oxidase subunit I
MLTACYLTTAFVVLAVGARYLVAGRHEADGRTMVRMAIGMIAILAPLQLFIGDQHGLNTLKYQPIKVAAMEAHWDGSKPGDFHLFAWPDEKNEKNLFEISIPRAASLILTHDPNGLFPGLTSVPASDRPPVKSVFFAFRIMVGIGLLMIATGLFGVFLWWRGKLTTTRWYLRLTQHGWWLGFVAILCGWLVTESGRQPWLVHGILRTKDAISPVSAASVLTTLILFVIVYGIVFTMGIYYINRLIVRGPQGRAIEPPSHDTPSRPLAAAHDAAREAMQPGG